MSIKKISAQFSLWVQFYKKIRLFELESKKYHKLCVSAFTIDVLMKCIVWQSINIPILSIDM